MRERVWLRARGINPTDMNSSRPTLSERLLGQVLNISKINSLF